MLYKYIVLLLTTWSAVVCASYDSGMNGATFAAASAADMSPILQDNIGEEIIVSSEAPVVLTGSVDSTVVRVVDVKGNNIGAVAQSSLSILLLLVEPCIYNQCSLVHRVHRSQHYMTPSIFLTRGGHLRLSFSLEGHGDVLEYRSYTIPKPIKLGEWIHLSITNRDGETYLCTRPLYAEVKVGVGGENTLVQCYVIQWARKVVFDADGADWVIGASNYVHSATGVIWGLRFFCDRAFSESALFSMWRDATVSPIAAGLSGKHYSSITHPVFTIVGSLLAATVKRNYDITTVCEKVAPLIAWLDEYTDAGTMLRRRIAGWLPVSVLRALFEAVNRVPLVELHNFHPPHNILIPCNAPHLLNKLPTEDSSDSFLVLINEDLALVILRNMLVPGLEDNGGDALEEAFAFLGHRHSNVSSRSDTAPLNICAAMFMFGVAAASGEHRGHYFISALLRAGYRCPYTTSKSLWFSAVPDHKNLCDWGYRHILTSVYSSKNNGLHEPDNVQSSDPLVREFAHVVAGAVQSDSLASLALADWYLYRLPRAPGTLPFHDADDHKDYNNANDDDDDRDRDGSVTLPETGQKFIFDFGLLHRGGRRDVDCECALSSLLSVGRSAIADLSEARTSPLEAIRLDDTDRVALRGGTGGVGDDVLQYLAVQARNGDPAAANRLAVLNYYGMQGVERNQFRALQYWQNAAINSPDALYNLGVAHSKGHGTVKNQTRALEFFEAAAANGHAGALVGLGVHQLNSLDNNTAAAEYFTRASELGSVDATFNLAVLYEGGSGVLRNFTRAVELYTSAADMGYIKAIHRLASMYSKRAEGFRHSCWAGVRLMKPVAVQVGALASIVEVALDTQLNNEDSAVSALWFQLSAATGLDVASYNAALLVNRAALASRERAQGTSSWWHELNIEFCPDGTMQPRCYSEASTTVTPYLKYISFLYYLDSALRGSTDGMLVVAHMLRNSGDREDAVDGSLGQKYHDLDADRAVDYSLAILKVAADLTFSSQAAFEVGWMLQHGVGAARNEVAARTYYHRSFEFATDDTESAIPAVLAMIWISVSGSMELIMSDVDLDELVGIAVFILIAACIICIVNYRVRQ